MYTLNADWMHGQYHMVGGSLKEFEVAGTCFVVYLSCPVISLVPV